MARLQDFPSVTPTSSDKILIVQSQSQGLAPHTIKLDSANPTGTGALSLNRKANTTVGTYSAAIGQECEASGNNCSFAEGYKTKANGLYGSHAEGANTVGSGNSSHAEGEQTTASATGSHAEGRNSQASGIYSHAENRGSVASGSYSHASGYGTIANHESQFAFGAYNVADPSSADSSNRGNYIEIVGKGANDANRSNARTLDWSGNEVLAGDLTINGSTSVGTALSALGTVVTGTTPSSVAVADGTVTEIESITLEAGTWLVIACADWAANATGYRQIALSAGVNPSRDRAVTTPTAGSGKETYQQIIQIITVNSQTAQKVYAMQNSGSSINVFPSVKAIRII
jgi:hypothetical protein